MGNWVNFAEIRARVSLEAVLIEMYGLQNLKRDGAKLVGPCPVHNGDSPRAFHADLQKNVWHCFSRCQKGGNQIDLVAQKEGISIREAGLKLQERFLTGTRPAEGRARAGPPAAPAVGVATPTAPQATPVKGAKPERNPAIDIDLKLRSDHPHITDVRRLSVETSSRFGVGFCSHGTLRGMIAVPIHDEMGELVAYAGRRLKPEDIRNFGKYKFPRGFRKELVLYNLHRAAVAGKEHGLILVEGFFAVLALYQAGFENVVAAMGCELSDHQVELLAAFPEIILLFDGDEAGCAATAAAREKLCGRTRLRTIQLRADLKPDELSVRALKWLVNGVQLLDLHEVIYRPYPKGT